MNEREIDALMDDVAVVVRAAISEAISPVQAELADLKAQIDAIKDAQAEEQKNVVRVSEMLAKDVEAVRSSVNAIELPTVDPEAFRAVAREEAEAAVKALPEPTEVDTAALAEQMRAGITEDIKVLQERVEDISRSAIDVDSATKIAEEVVRVAIEALPQPKDGVGGKSITDIDVSLTDEGRTAVFTFMLGEVEHSFEVPLVPGPKGEKGDPGEDGRDGVDVTDLFRAEDGRLIAVLGNGTTKDLGVYVGKDGEPGKDGRDGLGFDDMRLDVREEGTYLVWERGEVAKEAFLPVPFYRGVWSKDAGYRKGNTVTWGGSTWIATKDSPEGKPDTPDSDWVLSNKRGRDGKDAK